MLGILISSKCQLYYEDTYYYQFKDWPTNLTKLVLVVLSINKFSVHNNNYDVSHSKLNTCWAEIITQKYDYGLITLHLQGSSNN